MEQDHNEANLSDNEKKMKLFNAIRSAHRAWQTGSFPKEFKYAGYSFTALPTSFAMEQMGHDGFAKNLPIPKLKQNVSILEIGCGTGCVSCVVYLQNSNQIGKLLATDINPEAVQNTRLNFSRYKIPGEARQSDLFAAIKEGERFDIIMWNVPFYSLEIPEGNQVDNLLDICITDPNYNAIGRYMKEAPAFLNNGGVALIGFSSECGDLPLLEEVAKKQGKKLRLVWKNGNDTAVGDNIMFELFAVDDVGK